MKRKNLSKRQRFEVFKRDGFTCVYCGRTPPAVILEADHFVPVAEGGEDHERNMVTACFDCNRGKADVSINQLPASLDEQMRERRERSAQLRAYNDFLLELREEEADMVKRLGYYWHNKYMDQRDRWFFGDLRALSVKGFLKHLPEAEILDAIDVAFAKYPPYPDESPRLWKYFCGVCWTKIKRANGDD